MHLLFLFPPFYGVTLRRNSTNVRTFLEALLVITQNNLSLHAPPLQHYLRALQKGPSSLISISVLYRPTADDQRGRLYPLAVGAFLDITAPLCLVAPMLKLILLALIISFSNVFASLSWISLFPLLIDYGHFFLRIL